MSLITDCMALSSLLNRFNEPETLKMARLGRELRAKGFDIVDLSLGEPDFDTPDHIKEAAKKAIDDNYSHYTPVAGYLDLREAVCHKFQRDNKLSYKPENIVVSTGAKHSLANAILSMVEEGEEVIIPTPFWVTYAALVQLALGKVRLIKTTLEHGYKITAEELETCITPKTKLFIFLLHVIQAVLSIQKTNWKSWRKFLSAIRMCTLSPTRSMNTLIITAGMKALRNSGN